MYVIPRQAEATIKRLAKGFPVVCVTGPRQSGKSTLAKMAFPGRAYLSLDDPDIAHMAREDPRGLMDGFKDGLILDEAQTVPEIFSYLKSAVDSDPTPGRFIVTGSRQFDIHSGVTESLAGRAAFVRLLPFSMTELAAVGKAPADSLEAILRGFYPPLYDRDVTVYDWYTAYISSYIERDVRAVINVKDVSVFQTFVKMCAARSGQILNLSGLGADCGISHATAKAWLSILEAGGIVHLLRPYHSNFGKRLVKSPKLHFVDPGLAARLLGIRDVEQLLIHPCRGALFESMILSELMKKRLNQGFDPGLSFWRDNGGTEIDVVFKDGVVTKAIEMKSGKTFHPEHAAGLESWIRYSGMGRGDCAIVYAGELPMSWKGMAILPWEKAESIIP